MFSQKKIAAVSLLLGGLAVTGLGTTYAYADGAGLTCTHDAKGNTSCSQKTESTYTTKDGTLHVQQKQDCTSDSRERVDTPQSTLGGVVGTTHIGPTVKCSNNAPAPKGFKMPAILS